MDLPSLAVVLQAALSHNPEERKTAEESLNQFLGCSSSTLHNILVRLLQIIVNGNFDLAVRQVASIHFKNFVAKNWSPNEPGEPQKLSESDKEMVRENILTFIIQVPPLLRAQLGECLKTIINVDYPGQWPNLLHWIKCNLQMQDQQVYSALYVLRILSRKYEFKSDDERTPLYSVLEETFPYLLNIFNGLVQIGDPPLEVAELIRLICKIFWSSIYLEIPKQLVEPNIFNAWVILFLNLLERGVPVEGQPSDPEHKKSWGWWKVKKWTVHILNRLYTRFGDIKVQKLENKAFAAMFQKNYAGKILMCYLHILNVLRTGEYLPDRVINLLLQYLNCSISRNSMYQLLLPQLDILVFEIVFPLMCFNDNDQALWNEDPHEYVRKGYDIIEDLYSPRTAAMDFVSELVRKRGKGNLQKFIQFIVEIFRRYDESSIELKPYRQKDGALLAIGSLCDRLKQTEPYKSELEHMLVQHVFPEFDSHVGHLRAKAAWVAGQYAYINFSDKNNFRRALHSVIAGLRDPELPVRVDSVFALRFFIDACKDLNEIRSILPQLLDEFFKLMNEVENEDLVFTLETIVDKFGEEMAPYAIGLCQNLAAAFWRCMDNSEGDDESDNPGALAAAGCLRAISTILESVSRLPHLFIQIEPTLLPIMKRMLTIDGQEVFEEILEIVSYMTFFFTNNFFGDILQSCYLVDILVPLDNYISRSTTHFLTCKDPDYQQSLWNTLSTIMSDRNIDDADTKPAPKLIEVVFQNCKGQVNQWVEPYIRITVDRLRRTEKPYLKCLLILVIADALYYNPSLTLATLQRLGVATEVLSLWFQMLQQVKRNGSVRTLEEHDKKVCCLGLTSLMILPAAQLPVEALSRICRATLELLVLYKDQVAESKNETDSNDDNMDGSQTDDDNEDESLIDGTDDGGEEDDAKIQKVATQGSVFQRDDFDDDSDEDYSEDEDMQSPIDEVDPFIFFMETVQAVRASDPARFQNLMQSLDINYQSLATSVAQHAGQRKLEREKEKLEKAALS
ncbi:unnamed protein product [Spirodela intermedia]|uniref:Importin N-terminal domain-containing protein n=1 Tax=Spirodela intermedia TaxID=51605 RepID=A0A7I8JCP9_SPIIN|nr:unnamed protein product [Spirodela intermedia]CAA6667948.1 unnamed protein product [Spirodela intermedia]